MSDQHELLHIFYFSLQSVQSRQKWCVFVNGKLGLSVRMEIIKVPVTALHLEGDYLLSGAGSYLLIYKNKEQNKHKIVFSTKVLNHHVIHGIKGIDVDLQRFYIIFGGREWCICGLYLGEEVELKILYTSIVHDWIWDVSPIYEEEERILPDCVALALGHNSVLLYNWKVKTIMQEIHCEEKCILYSAHFVLNERPSWKSLVVCSGTVFNQVVIWKPATANGSTAKVIRRIQAHDGVIFDMYFHSDSGYLVTASDDRSIRIWKCDFLKHLSEEPISTDGFESNYLCKLYGHESRVWRARFVDYDGQLYLISIGEDGYCIIWKIITTLSVDGTETVEGKIVRKIKCHKGRNIWSLAIHKFDSAIATGGGDGGIRIWRLDGLINDETMIKRHPFTIDGIGSLKSIHLCDTGCVLGHTDAGTLLRFDIKTSSWSVVNEDTNFNSYAVMRVCDQFKLVATGNTKGEISILLFEADWSSVISKIDLQVTAKNGKIHNITWCVKDSALYMFVSGPEGELLCYKISVARKTIQILYEKIFSWTLPISKHRWHMGNVVLNHDDKMYVVCGDRRGSLHLFKPGLPDPLHTLHGIHGKNGVTSVQQVGKMLISTGRDGVWRKLKVDFDHEKILVMTQNRAAQGMDWLETVVKNRHTNNGLLILGFHGRNFTAWSSATGDTLLSVECGGGHRDWSFKTQDGYSTLAFVKESILNLAKVSRDVTKETSIVEPSFHGGQITCVKHIHSYYDQSTESNISFLGTGSEDTKVQISAFVTKHDDEKKLHHILTLDDHISSVRTISVIRIEESDHKTKILLFSGGGRASIKGYIVTVDKEACWEESCTVEHTFSHSLNMNCNGKRKSMNNVNPETRYMDLTAWKKGNEVLLAAACSDGVIRIFSADLVTHDITLSCQSSTYDQCFLTIGHFSADKFIHLIAGSTDGFIRIWNTNDINIVPQNSSNTVDVTPNMPPPCLNTKVHMSGINAMDLWKGFKNFKLLATGGDDNAIHLNVLSIENDGIKIISNFCIKDAHSTQITGLRFVFNKVTNNLELFSTSIDQRVTKWNVTMDTDHNIICVFVGSVLTDVADISSFVLFIDISSNNRNHIGVCGQGIQIINGSAL